MFWNFSLKVEKGALHVYRGQGVKAVCLEGVLLHGIFRAQRERWPLARRKRPGRAYENRAADLNRVPSLWEKPVCLLQGLDYRKRTVIQQKDVGLDLQQLGAGERGGVAGRGWRQGHQPGRCCKSLGKRLLED